jgi:hypothetical protein
LETEALAPEESPELNYEQVMVNFLKGLQQLAQQGIRMHHLRLNPALEAGFKAELERVPEEVLPAEIKAQLQIVADPQEEAIRIITSADIERMFLEQHFGPRDQGGNGLLPEMMKFFAGEMQVGRGVPVQLDLNWLRHRYLDEVAERVSSSRIQLASSLPPPGLLGRR